MANLNFTTNDIIKILNNIQLWEIDNRHDYQLGGAMMKSPDGDFLYGDDIAEAFGIELRYVDGKLKFVEKNTTQTAENTRRNK